MFNQRVDFESAKDEFGALPQGTYPTVIDKIGKYIWAEGKIDCTHDTGEETPDHFVELTFNLIGDKYKGRKHFENLKLWHENQTVANIARVRFKEICAALQVDPAKGSFDDLLNKPLKITIKHSKQTKQDGTPYINISKISALNSEVGAKPTLAKKTQEDDFSDVPF